MTDGWLFDSYPLKDKMILWIKQETANDTIMLEDNWSHSIYVAANNKTELKSILEAIGQNDYNITN